MEKNFFKKIILLFFSVLILIGSNYTQVFASDTVPELQPYSSINSEGYVYSSKFSLDGKYIATGHDLGKITLWNSSTIEKVFSTTVTNNNKKVDRIAGIKFSPDGKLIATYADNCSTIWILDSSNGNLLNTINLGSDTSFYSYITDIAFSPDGKTLYSCVRSSDLNEVIFSDVQTGNSLKNLTFNSSPNCIAYNTSNDTIAIGLGNGLIVIKNAKTGEQIKNIDTKNTDYDGANYLQYDSNNETLLCGSSLSETILLLDVSNNYTKKLLDNDPNTFMYKSLEASKISPDNNLLICSYGSKDYLFDFKTGKALYSINENNYNNVNQADFDKNSNILIIGSNLYDLSSIERKKLTKVKINADKTTLNYDDKANISLTGYYDDGTSEQIQYKDATWNTSDFNTAIVTGGTIIARGSGKASISVDYKGLKDNLDITVSPKDTTEYKILETMYDQPVDKTFELAFTAKVDISTIKEQNIYVTDPQGNIVPMFYYCNQGTENKISIIPVKNYVSGQAYTLWVKDVKCTDGRVLKHNTKMDFTIK